MRVQRHTWMGRGSTAKWAALLSVAALMLAVLPAWAEEASWRTLSDNGIAEVWDNTGCDPDGTRSSGSPGVLRPQQASSPQAITITSGNDGVPWDPKIRRQSVMLCWELIEHPGTASGPTCREFGGVLSGRLEDIFDGSSATLDGRVTSVSTSTSYTIVTLAGEYARYGTSSTLMERGHFHGSVLLYGTPCYWWLFPTAGGWNTSGAQSQFTFTPAM